MDIHNEKERLNNSSEMLKCNDCNLIIEEEYAYCRKCKKKVCLKCLINHNINCKNKLNKENENLKEIKLDIINNEISNLNINNEKYKNSRNYGIDLLRIYSMINVVILHIMSNGKIIYSNKYSKNYYSAWLLETISYSAVNTFGMISGYVMINSKFNGFKIIPHWLHFFYYKFIFVFKDLFISPKKLNNWQKKDLLFSLFFPATSGKNWYFTCYFCMYFFIPFMNKLILVMSKEENRKLFLTIIIIFCILPFIPLNTSDPFSIKRGYCPFWLMFLYIIGAYIRLFPLQLSITKYLILYLLSIIIPWGIKLISHFIMLYFYKIKDYELGIFIQYNSFFIVLNAICLITNFSKLQIDNKFFKFIIGLTAELLFGVYLIHLWILDKFLKKQISFLIKENYLLVNVKVIIYSLETVLLCLLFDLIRLFIFKVLKINILSKILSEIFENLIK